MKKLSFLLIVLFVLVGCTSNAKKTSAPKELGLETSVPQKNKKYEFKIIPDLTVEDVSKTLEPLRLTFEEKKHNPRLPSVFVWQGAGDIQKGDNDIHVICTILGYSENEIVSISVSASARTFDSNKVESFHVEALEILRYAAKIPTKGADNKEFEEDIKYFITIDKNTLITDFRNSFAINGLRYTVENSMSGSSKEIDIRIDG